MVVVRRLFIFFTPPTDRRQGVAQRLVREAETHARLCGFGANPNPDPNPDHNPNPSPHLDPNPNPIRNPNPSPNSTP